MSRQTGAAATHPATRGTICIEDAIILSQSAYPGDQFVMRIEAPGIARNARAGAFVHLRCDPSLLMRRPMSIMRADADAGWIDILYKAHGMGTRLLAGRRHGDHTSVMGPIGVPFRQSDYRRLPLLIGGGVGIPPMVFLAEHMRRHGVRPVVFMGSEIPFPFTPRPSTIMVPGLPAEAIAAMPLLEDWKIPSRLASGQGFAGCFPGLVTDLARQWLDALSAADLQEVEIFSCGPMPMLRAVAALARDFSLPCQVSVEEYMACAVGGCAGCTIPVNTPSGRAMLRVCVDGPVFEAAQVFPG